MKKKIFILSFILSSALFSIYAQEVVNYQKLGVPSVDGGGKVYDADKNVIGRVDKDGAIYDAKDVKVAKFDAFSNVIEEGTGENFGKSDANGNHLIVANKKVNNWKSNNPENAGIQICLIKNKNGKLVGAVNKVHKQYGTGALFYLVKKYIKNDSEASETTVVKSKTVTKQKGVKKTTVKKKVIKKK